MSFAQDVKKELTMVQEPLNSSESELVALIILSGSIHIIDKRLVLELKTENSSTSRRIYMLFKMVFKFEPQVIISKKNNLHKNTQFTIRVIKEARQVFDHFHLSLATNLITVPEQFLESNQQQAAFLRGSFLATGSVSDPRQSSYHLELSTQYDAQAKQIQSVMQKGDFNARLAKRRNGWLVYLKEAEKISDFLQWIKATDSMLRYEDERIVRDMRNSVNRVVNCETANINKTIAAAQKQIANIQLIYRSKGKDGMPEKWRSIAEIRVKYPEASTEELSKLLREENGEIVTKSGVNYRLRKINEFAQVLKV